MRKIYFRADASSAIGYGHFIRTLALADMLKDAFECTFFTCHPTPYQVDELEKVCSHIVLQKETHYDDFLFHLKGEEIVVLDNYFYTSEYQKQIKEKGCKLVCIDDMHDKHYYADVVINHGLTDENLFDIEPYTRLCLGFDYALLRRPFIQVSNTVKLPDSWFISFGGTDFLNLTEKTLKAIHGDPRVDSITVVIGDAYKYIEDLKNYPKATIKKNLTAEEMAGVMRKTQYAILPSSSVCIEALACRCKVAAGFFISNQQPYHDEWSRNGFILGLGNIAENIHSGIIDQLSESPLYVQVAFTNIVSKYIEIFKQL